MIMLKINVCPEIKLWTDKQANGFTKETAYQSDFTHLYIQEIHVLAIRDNFHTLNTI